MEIGVSRPELPSMSFKGEKVEQWRNSHRRVTDVPSPFRQKVQYTLLSNLSCRFKRSGFFSAQNVFVPGVRFIQATEHMMPHDVVLLGAMPDV